MTQFGKVSRAAVVALTPAQLRVYALLCVYRNRDGEAWPRTSTMALDLGISEGRTREVLRELAGAGWIERRKIEDDRQRWLVHLEPEAEGEAPEAEGEQSEGRRVSSRPAEGDPPKPEQTPLLGTDQEQTKGSGDRAFDPELRAKLRSMALQGMPLEPRRFQRLVIDCWAVAVGKNPNAVKLTQPRAKLIDAARRLYGVDNTIKAAEGISLSDFHMGRERGKPARHDDLEVALRLKPRNNVEHFTRLWDEEGGVAQQQDPPEGLNGAPLIIAGTVGWAAAAAAALRDGWTLQECLTREPTRSELLEVEAALGSDDG